MTRFVLTTLLVTATTLSAAQIKAFDNAANSIYDDGVQNGEQGGMGFEPWSIFVSADAQHFMGSSNTNGAGQGPGIDTGGRSWGARAREVTSFNSLNSVTMARYFTNRSFMMPGDRFSVDFDAGPLVHGLVSQWGGPYVQIGMLGFAGGPSQDMSLIQVGPHPLYSISDTIGGGNLIPVTHGGVRAQWEVLTERSYRLTMTNLSTNQSTSYLRSGAFLNTRFEGFFMQVRHVGLDPERSAFINSTELRTVPEPATLAALSMGALMVFRKRRAKVKV